MSAAVTAELVDLSDLFTPTALSSTLARSFMENNDEVGTGFVTFANDDPDLALVVTPNTLVNFSVYGVPAFTIVLESADATYASENEDHDLVTVWNGSGVASLFDRVTVDPALALGARPVEEERAFNWSAAIYDWSAATTPQVLCSVLDAQTGTWPVPWDADFAATGADVLGPSVGSVTAAPVGACYYQQTVIVLTAGTYQVQVLMDNYGEVFFDGALLMSPGQDNGRAEGFTQTSKASIELSPGIHTINARVFNAPFGILNPTGYAFCVVELNPDGTVGSVIASSEVSGGALIFEYPADPPGMTPGAIMLLLISEGQHGTALGGGRATGDSLAFINLVNTTFDAVNDTNGNPWPVVADYATKVGTTLLQVLRELTTYADFWFTPATLDFNMAITGQRGITPGVNFHRPTAGPETGNIIEWTAKTEGAKTNALLVRSNVGWTDRTDGTSITALGRIEGSVSYGAVSSIDEVNRTADADLADFARERTQHTIGILPAGGDVPFDDFHVADTVTLEGNPHVVLGLGATEDDTMERPQFAIVLNDGIVLDAMERIAQWLTKQVPLTIGGRSKRAQPFIPRYVPRSLGEGPTAAADCLEESFDTSDGTTIGPDLTWTSYAQGGGFNGRAEIHSDKFGIGSAAAGPYFFLQANIREVGGCGNHDMVTSGVVGAVAAGQASTTQRLMVGARVIDPAASGLSGAGAKGNLGYWLVVQQTGASGAWQATVCARDGGLNEFYDVAANTTGSSPPNLSTLGAPITAGDILAVKVTGVGFVTVIEGYVNGVLVASATVGSAFLTSRGATVAGFLNTETTPGLDLYHSGASPGEPVAKYDISFESMEACPFT